MQPQDVAHGIVFIILAIALQGFRAIGERDADDGLKIFGITLGIVLRGMFPAFGVDQTIQGVIDVGVARFYAGVVEEHRLLGSVADVGNVAHRVVGVGQVLQGAFVGFGMFGPRGEQVDQTERVLVIGVLRDDGMACLVVFNAHTLALGIVVDVGDGLQVRGRRIQQVRRFGGLLQPDIHPFEQVGFVVTGADNVELGAGLIAVRRDELDRAVEGIVAGAAAEYLGFQRRTLRPVGRGLVILDQLAGAAQQIALEIKGFISAGGRILRHADDKTSGIVMLIRLAAQVELSWHRPDRFRAYRRKSFSRTG